MAAILEKLTESGSVQDEVARLAERVQQSVVVVRGARSGTGSGVVWNNRGMIVTNHHVVPREEAIVETANGDRLAAKVLRRDPIQDLALLQVEDERQAQSLISGVIGASSSLKVGQIVLAVGNPLGERNAVTLGVVSGSGMPSWIRRSGEAVQVAITLRPGNSGGALANIRGEIVGIPNMVIGEGLALAVPSDVVVRFLQGEEVNREPLGVTGQWVEVPSALIQRHHLPFRAGMLLLGVTSGSVAERAGLTLGDVVIGLDHVAGDSTGGPLDQLHWNRDRHPSGSPARQLAFLRGGELHWIELAG